MTVQRAGNAALLAFALVCASPDRSARAYTFESPFGEGCHEKLTIEALRDVRARSNAARPLPASDAERAWIDDLPVDLPRDARDLGAASLVAGVRHNDLKGAASLEPSELAHAHGDPNAQREHCLRAPEHDEPRGTPRALEACRDYILERFELAVRHGFDASGQVDPEARTRLEISLDFRGRIQVPMPLAYAELGQALHAVQDSFSHAVRSDDGLRVRVLLNWIDYAHERLDEPRDGPAHRAPLDACEDLDELRRLRWQRAFEASTALLHAAFQDDLAPDEKLERAHAVLDRYLSYEPGCDASNRYCDAPELSYEIANLGCAVRSTGAPTHRSATAMALCTIALVASARRRRRAPRSIIAVLLLSFALTSRASADEPTQHTSPFAARAAVSASIDEMGAALALGGRYRLTPAWLAGLDAEWNPWASMETARVQPGALNIYATGVFRAPVNASLALRITAHAGISTLLFDMYGAPSGSIGPYFGLSLLGLEVPLSHNLILTLEPADVAIAIPHISGIPYARRQYRATLGVELTF